MPDPERADRRRLAGAARGSPAGATLAALAPGAGHSSPPRRGPLTRAEIVEQLARSGIRLEGQARPHLIARAALEGVVCLGPDRGPRGTEPTYVLLERAAVPPPLGPPALTPEGTATTAPAA